MRVAEVMRQVVTRPIIIMSSLHLAKGFLRERSKHEFLVRAGAGGGGLGNEATH